MGKFDHLLSPLKVGNHLFKNRIVLTPTTPQFLQEDEGFPAETQFQHYLRRVKNGAALVCLSGIFPFDEENPMPERMKDHFIYDVDRRSHHYMSQLVEDIHGFGSFATIQLQHVMKQGYDISPGAKVFSGHDIGATEGTEELTEAMLKAATEEVIRKATILQKIGFDGVFLHMSYQQSMLGRSISPLINKRTDNYGGTFENRLRLVTETCEGIKKACGKDFIIEAHITGEERDNKGIYIPGGWSVDDSVRFAEAMSGLIDILHLRNWSINGQHPLWLMPDEPPNLSFAERCMEAVTDTKILTTSGHKDPKKMDKIIAEGQADLIGVARSLIADPYFIEKLYDDRADDIVPCIRCNKCFETGPAGTPRTCRCSVNPLWGFESRDHIVFTPPLKHKKILIAGGGPAGMEAALVCKERGHEVVLYEKSDALGGQLKIADYSPEKWALKDFKNFLAYQVDKQGIEVHLNTPVTPEMLENSDSDVVIAALGSTPKMPSIPGIERENVTTIIYTYGNEDELGQNIVIVGGGSSAIETGMHLANSYGRSVTVLGRNSLIAKDLPPVFCRGVEQEIWESTKGLTAITNASVVEINDKGVVYQNGNGETHTIPADTVLIGIGMEPLFDETISLHGHGPRLVVVGDDRIPGSIMDAMRDAYFAAAQL